MGLFSKPGEEHSRGAKFVLACFFWITFPYGQWRREQGFEGWVWCMVFFFSAIMTLLFFAGAAAYGEWEAGLATVIEQIRYTYYRSAWIWAGWFGLDTFSFRDLNQNYGLFAHWPFLYLLPFYGTFIHFFFKPARPVRSWT